MLGPLGARCSCWGRKTSPAGRSTPCPEQPSLQRLRQPRRRELRPPPGLPRWPACWRSRTSSRAASRTSNGHWTSR
eukprot:2292356-Alexandrium_andersonii.AAC.1